MYIRGRIGAVLLVAIFLPRLFSAADPEKVADLEARLETVRTELAGARAEARKLAKDYYAFEHDVVYSNDVAAAVYKEIKGLEKRLVEKKRELNEMMQALPEMRKIVSDQRSMASRIRELESREKWFEKRLAMIKAGARKEAEKEDNE